MHVIGRLTFKIINIGRHIIYGYIIVLHIYTVKESW